MDANQEERKAEMKTVQQKIDANNEKFEVLRDTFVSRTDVHQERMMACPGKTKATDLGANSAKLQSVAEHREVPKEHAAVKPVKRTEEAA
jgi:hypothetical protein